MIFASVTIRRYDYETITLDAVNYEREKCQYLGCELSVTQKLRYFTDALLPAPLTENAF
jgi:hypothetical protein